MSSKNLVRINKNIFHILYYWVTLLFFVSCLNNQTGEQLYKNGLTHFESSDHGDYYDQEELKKAISQFEKSIEKGFYEREVYYWLSLSYLFFNSDNENAERIYSLGVNKFQNDIGFHFGRGSCRKKMRKHKEAFEDFNKVILLDTSRKYEYLSNAFYERGAMSFILGDTINAIKDRDTAQSMKSHQLRTYKDYCQLWK